MKGLEPGSYSAALPVGSYHTPAGRVPLHYGYRITTKG